MENKFDTGISCFIHDEMCMTTITLAVVINSQILSIKIVRRRLKTISELNSMIYYNIL